MTVSTRRVGDYLHITVENPPVNALSHAVRAGIVDALHKLSGDTEARGALLLCNGRTFIAGADIREMGQPDRKPLLPDVITALRQSAKPVVACLHGTVLGGGLEIALACHYRIALKSTRLGFPEVQLGLVPGAGGTQFLPRVVDIQTALDMITGGKPVNAHHALDAGLLELLADDTIVDAATRWLDQHRDQPLPALAESPASDTLDADAWVAFEKQLTKRARGQSSPVKAMQLVRRATETALSEGLAEERATFLELRASSQSAALRHLFFAERAVARPASLKPELAQAFNTVGVIGAGTMGSGIATSALNADLHVILVERDDTALQRGLDAIKANLAAAVKRQLISETSSQAALARLSSGTSLTALANADVIIEAVYEDMAVKQAIFKELDAIAKPDAILASNTSYLDVNEIASATARPESVIGLHFFSPAHVMKLLEIVKADASSDAVVATGFALAGKLRKTAVQVGVCDGFVGNRILREYRFQAETMLEEGCLPEQIDQAMTALGFPMGPFAMQDMAGLDISWANRKKAAPTRDPRQHYVDIADTLCEAGRFGQKTGAGWYRYESGSRTPHADQVTEQLIIAASEKRGICRRQFQDRDIQLRLIAAMANEGARILEEKIAGRPLDIDVIYVNGYGFPRHLGGPMHYAGTVGLDVLSDLIAEVAQRYPCNVRHAALLNELVATGKDFSSLDL